MKKHLLIILILAVIFSQEVFAGFYAQRINTYDSWSTTQVLKFETKYELFGLFYETTINLKLKLGQEDRWDYSYYPYTHYCANPPSGNYEFIWNFTLPQNSYIKDLMVWDKSTNSFRETATIDLTTGEQNYNSNSSEPLKTLLRQNMRRDYNGSYNLQYDMRISPVRWDESVELIIKIISPCEIAYNKRIIDDYSNQFYSYNSSQCFTNANANLLVKDYNNPDTQPQLFNGSIYYGSTPSTWSKSGDFWKTLSTSFYSFRLFFPEESSAGKYLQTTSIDEDKFYQLTTKPQISDELRYPRKIVAAFDLVQQYFGSYSRVNFLNMLKYVLKISTTEKDSMVFVTSDFDVAWLNKNFIPRTEDLINTSLNSVNQIVPKLNTLPYMLKEIVQYLNEQNSDAEVWLVSDDYQTGVRAETVMELLEQTYYKAKNNIIFKIIDASNGYGYYNIQNKYYRGNEYLYQNLTRLSGGNFNPIYDLYYMYHIDEALDCWAPKVTTVEIDPIPGGGFSFSRSNLNGGKNNFDITARYGQYGMFEGNTPFNVSYYGNYLGSFYFKSFDITEDNSPVTEDVWENTGLYWYGNYIMNDLFLQPQSYSTIKYIEELSVKHHILTPYSAFIIPSPSGYSGYIRKYEDEMVVSVKNEDEAQNNQNQLPKSLNLSCYPNPFNPQTTIVMKFPNELIKGEKKLDIYNILGQKVRSFDLSSYINSFEIKVDWNGLNDSGIQVSSGTYIAVLKTGKEIKTLKLLLVR